MQRKESNLYIVVFAIIITIILGGSLSIVSQSLKPLQKEQIELDTKKQILKAVMNIESKMPEEINAIYEQRIQSTIVDHKGKSINSNDLKAESINIGKEYKKDIQNKLLPVFKYMSQSTDEVEAYIIPAYGKGLWNDIWGYIAIKPDFNTIKGVSFDHIGETPGLGARITSLEVQERYKDKKLYDEEGNFASIIMLKGEKNDNLNDHQVDGMSGATITGNGVNIMLEDYMKYYQEFFKNYQENL